MSYTDPDTTDLDDVESGDERSTRALREAREAADRNAAKAKRTDTLERELAIVRALPGVDHESPLAKMFASSYDGKLEVDEIKAAAVSVGLIDGDPAPPPAPVDQVDPADAARQAASEQLAHGAAPPATEEEQRQALHPKEVAFDAFKDGLKKGLPREKAAGAYFDHMVSAAVGGDERAQWSGWSPEELEAMGVGQ